MAREKPLSITTISDEEVSELTKAPGHRAYKWDFPEEVFNGDWWAIEVPNGKVASALNSFRNQSEAIYGTAANCYRSTDGRLMVRRLVNKPKAKARPKKEEVS